MKKVDTPLLIKALSNDNPERAPVWLMRQAGRYLPEYRAIREKFTDFIEFCLTPEAATEVTLQPVYRFNVDAAIIFADILTIPHALGHEVKFSPGYGPMVKKIELVDDVKAIHARLPDMMAMLAPVAETVRLTRKALPNDKAVIGFSGAPFTLACYLFDDKPSQGIERLVAFQKEYPEAFDYLIKVLTEACTVYLLAQLKAGADAVQIFDSWASACATACPPALWKKAVERPLLDITYALQRYYPATPVILFPRLASEDKLIALTAQMPMCSAVSLSDKPGLSWALKNLPEHVALQGNLDPALCALDDAEALVAAAKNALNEVAKSGRRNYVLNLAHGLTPETKIDNIAALTDVVRGYFYKDV